MLPEVIFFDKDGTLIDFDAFWVSVTRYVLNEILNKYSLDVSEDSINKDIDTLLQRLGVVDGKTDIDGILCKGTYKQISEIVFEFLKDKGIEPEFEKLNSEILSSFNQNSKKGCVLSVCDNIRSVLINLKNKGIKLCVVTTDNPEITDMCLDKLGILDLFDAVYTDDGIIPPKPDKASVEDYCGKTGISNEKMLMVGDTLTDVKFARNAGIKVVCVGREENRKKLEEYADASIPDISFLSDTAEVLFK